jgi:uncharacterized membrane protein
MLNPKLGSKSKARQTPNDIREDQLGLERLVFFSDAVFAIAITLLILEIRLPAASAELNNEELLSRLLEIWPEYMGYVISFSAIGSFWYSHHRKFRYIERYDDRLLWLNLLWLMVIAFIPFPTAVLSEYGNRTATIFYALTMTAAGLLSAVLWWYAVQGHRLVAKDLDTHVRRRGFVKSLVLPLIFLVSIGLAFLNEDLAKYSWFLIAPAMVLTR